MRILLLAPAVILMTGCFSERRESQQPRDLDRLLERARVNLQSSRYVEARKVAEQGLGLAGVLGDPVAQWRFRLLRCEILLDERSSPTADLADLHTPMPSGPAFAALAARQKMLEGKALVNLGKAKEAEPVLQLAYRLADDTHDDETLIDIENLKGTCFILEKRWDTAEDLLRRALKRSRDNHLPYREPSILINLGTVRLARHRVDDALGYFQRAADLARPTAGRLYTLASANLAMCYYRLGEFDRAIQIQLQSVQHEKSYGASYYSQLVLGVTGNAYLMKGDTRSAVKYLEGALTDSKKLGANKDSAIWVGNLAILYGDLGEWDKAEIFNKEAVRIKTDAGSRTLIYNTLNAASIAVGRGRYAEGERLYRAAIASSPDNPAVLWDAYGAIGGSAMLQHRPGEACRYFESAVTIVEQTRSELLNTEYKLPFLTRLIRFYQQYVDALVAQGDYERALAVADSSRAQVLAERFESARVRRLSPAALKSIARDTGSAVVTYFLGPVHSYAWVVSADRIRHAVLPPEKELEKLVADYTAAIQDRLADPVRTRIPAGENLFHVLLEPLRDELAKSSRVTLVPDGVLAGLNFETLPVPGTPAHYWIEDATITVAPSISVLNRAARHPDTGRGILLIGDPETSDPAFPPLAHAAAEIDSVLRHFDSDARLVLRGKDAVPQSYQNADAGRFSFIHFTAHAIASRESPLDSAVLLTGGKLYARDVMDRPLNADLVTLSACRGAGARVYGGEGLVGFAWAFLRAGARNVIAGLWDVNDQSTADLMDVTYREIEAGKKPQDALRTAKLALIRSPRSLKKPYYWGPFQVYTLAP